MFGFPVYQGGAELALWDKHPRELIVGVIQALVIPLNRALDQHGPHAARKFLSVAAAVRPALNPN